MLSFSALFEDEPGAAQGPLSAYPIGVPEFWQSRAEEARAIAAQLTDQFAIKTMEEVAANYEKIAEQAKHTRLWMNRQGKTAGTPFSQGEAA